MSTACQRVRDALRRQPTDRVPWVPFVGVHGGALLGRSATDYLQSSDLLVAGLQEARRRYAPDGLPVVFDLQLEAEVLGCRLAWAEDAPPSVASHPLAEGKQLADLPDFDLSAGRFPVVLEAMRRLRQEWGEEVALYGLVTGPLTLAMHLWGTELFLALFDDPEGVQAVIDHCAEIGRQVAEAYLAAGCSVIAVVDPMLSQVGPDVVSERVLPAANRIFDAVAKADGRSSLFVCGDASRNLAAFCADARCDNISIDENIDLDQLVPLAAEHGKSVGGNLRLTVVLLLGDEDNARRDALRCLTSGGETGFVLAPGCDLPYGVPPANVAAAGSPAADPYQREIAAATTAQPTELPDFPLPDYAREDAVLVDIVTLDSAACPPCRYMVDAVSAAAAIGDLLVQWQEHKITGADGLAAMQALGVGQIPSICIDGQVAFASRIPDRRELLEALRAAAERKSIAR